MDSATHRRMFDTSDASLVAVFSAVMTVVTLFAIPLPFGGITHFGNTVMWTASILFGGLVGGLVGGIGGMIADLILGSPFAFFTFFCKLASGLACGLVSKGVKSVNKMDTIRIVMAVAVGAVVNRLAYVPVYWFLFGPGSAILWLSNLLLPTAITTYVAAPIITLGVMRAYPRVVTYRAARKDRTRFW